ncbi:3-hydroxyacyl-CoA dehydrogenase NAD-binding domain-containing protein [Chitinasiproducens palmae]|uniref:3-hydroxyacyl-CoA dehydrogenase n=1 Tax=Chitinasiproducens palmae TaxID=1770053 RepID=A0A1H2PU50_9BURK|nr:3-hydroxyacyl-CoA dehydrogenase NAD-binding domain-containing protein [Chitinasiproducens palmae]SDV50685.1 3-hydroxyacyl-CoA dehydrogenase [Chitinasiproducens palmae]
MEYEHISQVAVIGTGTIGASWAALFLARGLRVNAYDPAPGAADRLRRAVADHWPTLERIGLASDASADHLRCFEDLEDALTGVHFVQENGPENEADKRTLLARIDALLPADAIIASSTSGLTASAIQSACAHPARVLVGHPFNPPHLIPLVEVVGGEHTCEAAVERTLAFYRALGKRPIRLRKEMKGHVANRLQAALWREAMHLVATGAVTVAELDDAVAYGPGLRWAACGPFLNLHLSGGAGGMQHVLDHLGAPIEAWWDDLGTPRITPDLAKAVVDGTHQALANRSNAALEAQRDALILDLLRRLPR